jgi:asparagine synthetase B (glutamine-hydrolysing)
MVDDFIILSTKEKNISVSNVFKYQLDINKDLILVTNSRYSDFNKSGKRVIIIGDCIDTEEILYVSKDNDIPKLRGNFYAVVVYNETVKIYNSFFSILPLYYSMDRDVVSSSIDMIKMFIPREYTVDKKYILESLLFNYGFFNRTICKEIKLLPCHSFVQFTNNHIEIHKHFLITELFVSTPRGGKKVADELSELFIKTSKHYFPDEHFDIAFTSGFDGRTIVSCALHHNKKFSTFSFGRPEIDDVHIPSRNAQTLGIPYQSFDVSDKEYLDTQYLENADEYNTRAYKGNGFLQAHYVYTTKKISQQSRYMLSGYVGSELFRALHTTGTVTSLALRDVFITTEENTLKTKLRTSKALEVLNINEFVDDLEELVDEILEYKRSLSKKLTINQQFYIFVFEEIIRKFFGQKIAVQQQYLNVRTPFLDYQFVKTLLQTKYAGANNDFFTQNPLKRTKGQYIYTDIIRKTNKIIYRQRTGKGYRPIDVRNIFYMMNIIYPFFKKRFVKKVKKTYMDNFGIVSGIQSNKEKVRPYIDEGFYFDQEKLTQMFNDLTVYTVEHERDTLLMSLSILKNINSFNSKEEPMAAK